MADPERGSAIAIEWRIIGERVFLESSNNRQLHRSFKENYRHAWESLISKRYPSF